MRRLDGVLAETVSAEDMPVTGLSSQLRNVLPADSAPCGLPADFRSVAMLSELVDHKHPRRRGFCDPIEGSAGPGRT